MCYAWKANALVFFVVLTSIRGEQKCRMKKNRSRRSRTKSLDITPELTTARPICLPTLSRIAVAYRKVWMHFDAPSEQRNYRVRNASPRWK
jgi:hypothetical protein